MVLITIVTGAYKPTNITGGPHIVEFLKVHRFIIDNATLGFLLAARLPQAPLLSIRKASPMRGTS